MNIHSILKTIQKKGRTFFYFVPFIFLFSCGQVGTITGGEKDVTAPGVLVSKVIPPNYSTSISPEKIVIPFNEFIELNKPSENISVTPSDVKLEANIKKKSLILTKTAGEWQENTTYTIYLNRVVRDITERNDSIMSFVFSTGNFLDSLQTALKIIDAYNGNPVADITVGLYTEKLIDDTSKINPRYFSSTDKDGIAIFQNIKNQEYFAYAFEDENRNNRLDKTEKRATLHQPVELHPKDTLERAYPTIRLMPPEENELTITSNEVSENTAWCLGFNRTLTKKEDFIFLDSAINVLWNKERDSVTAFYRNAKNSGAFSGMLITEEKKDTIQKKYFLKKIEDLKVQTNLVNNKLKFQDTLKIILSEPVQFIDTHFIQFTAIPKDDSVSVNEKYSIIDLSPLEIGILFEKENQENLFLNIAPNGILSINSSLKDSLKLDFSLQTKRETGTMIIEFDTLPPYGILYVNNPKNKQEIKVIFDGIEKKNHQIDFLEPGEYQFYFLIDEDKNGKWTTGSVFHEKQAEEIIWLPEKTMIRANWEVKTTLEIKQKMEE